MDGHLATYLESLRFLEAVTWGTLYPGHGPPAAGGRAVIQKTLEHRKERAADPGGARERAAVAAVGRRAPPTDLCRRRSEGLPPRGAIAPLRPHQAGRGRPRAKGRGRLLARALRRAVPRDPDGVDAPHLPDVGEGVLVQDDEVRPLALLESAQLVETEAARRVRRRGAEDLLRGES